MVIFHSYVSLLEGTPFNRYFEGLDGFFFDGFSPHFGMLPSAILPQEFLWNMHTMLVAAPGSIDNRRTGLNWLELIRFNQIDTLG